MTDLKPCPKCDFENPSYNDDSYKDKIYIECDKCGHRAADYDYSAIIEKVYQAAAKIWNAQVVEEISPCLFCCSKDVVFNDGVRCNSCGAQGPVYHFNGKEDAIKEWNEKVKK